MDPITKDRLFNTASALEQPVARLFLISLAILLAAAPLLFAILTALKLLTEKTRQDLWLRYFSWLLFIPMMFAPIFLGAFYVITTTALLALACYREFARATGLFRHHLLSLLVVLGILALSAATLDNWYGFFVALTPITLALITTTALLADNPTGYIQRTALALFAFLLFGVCFAHLAYFANDTNYRPILLWLISSVELNDIFAYITGKSLGKRKLAPNTSPNKTLAGFLGALLLTTAFAAALGHFVFLNSPIDTPLHLLTLGLLLSLSGQLGDLTLASIKRDLHIKDWSNTFPGHGGLLDRFNSLLLAAPCIFHYLRFFDSLTTTQTPRIFF